MRRVSQRPLSSAVPRPLSPTSSSTSDVSEEQWWAVESEPSSIIFNLLRGPLAVLCWIYGAYLVFSLIRLSSRPISRDTTIDEAWLTVILPAMYVPTLIVWSYLSWLGWQFFKHN